ncbi:MAG TPA: RidA family protein [Thermoanaerobaculia bacterium]|jgi:2-iminobutanoate/2-iminopropanoate deaminase
MRQVLHRALAAGALLALGLAAFAPAAGETRRHINLPGRTSTAPFSDAVLAGDTLYLAGRLGLDASTGKPPADPAAEARLILDGMKSVLAQAGMTMDDLVSVQVFCPDVSLYADFNKVYASYFTAGRYPARAFIGSGPLLFGARFEVQGTAVRAAGARPAS